MIVNISKIPITFLFIAFYFFNSLEAYKHLAYKKRRDDDFSSDRFKHLAFKSSKNMFIDHRVPWNPFPFYFTPDQVSAVEATSGSIPSKVPINEEPEGGVIQKLSHHKFHNRDDSSDDENEEKLEFKCGRNRYNPVTHLCCSSRVIEKKGHTNKCCGPVAFDSRKQTCCRKSLVTKKKNRNFCCAYRTYDWATQQCCDDTVVERRSENGRCCGKQRIDADNELCCFGVKYPMHPTKRYTFLFFSSTNILAFNICKSIQIN